MTSSVRIHVAIFIMQLVVAPTVFSDDATPIPANKAQINSWFQNNVKPYAARKGTLDPALEAAEASPKIIKVRKEGNGDFKTITEAINSIPSGNTQRVIIWISAGEYVEKLNIGRDKPFVTLFGSSPRNRPKLVFAGTAAKYGTVYSGTLTMEADYFTAVNLEIVNSSPAPAGTMGAQALAMRILGNKAAFYNVRFIGFQDTLCDDKGMHFFKDCYVEGTVDFVFGDGKSLYLNSELRVVAPMGGFITAHSRESNSDDSGYSFAHCRVTGNGKDVYLGRAWRPYPKVVFSYTDMAPNVHPEGWTNNFHPEREKTAYFAEYKCTGAGSSPSGRVKFTKQLTDAQAKPFLTLAYIQGSKWLLPPPTISK